MTRTSNSVIRALGLLTCVGLLHHVCFAQTVKSKLSPSRARAIDQAVIAEAQAEQAVGVAIGIIQKGQVVYLKGYGWQDRENGVPVSLNTMFRWASVSKTLTAVSAMQLNEKGKLNLNANIRDYVPEFPTKPWPITAQQLLCHQSGIPHYSNGQVIPTIRNYPVPHPFEDVVVGLDKFNQSPLLFQPGTQFSYTTYGFMLLSAVVQRAGGQKFADQVRDRISTPLGLRTLQPDYQWKDIPNRAVGYFIQNNQVVRSTDTDVSWKLGGGGFISNVEDMTLYAQGLMQYRLVSPRTSSLMWTSQRTSSGASTGYGLGFVTAGDKVSHGGAQEKARCQMNLYPKDQRAIIVMSNSEQVDPTKFTAVIDAALKKTNSVIDPGALSTIPIKGATASDGLISPRKTVTAMHFRPGSGSFSDKYR